MAKLIKLADGTDFTINDAIESIMNSGQVVLTDNDALYMQRQLEFIEQTTYDTLYPDLEARELFGVDSSGGPGVTSLTFRSYNMVGKAKVINARATDLPKPNIKGKEYTIPVKSVGTSYDYDVDEIASAQFAGMSLEARKALAATRGYEQYVNATAWYGDEANGFIGFFDNPEITRANVTAGASGKTEWEEKDPNEVLRDLNGAVASMYASTLKIMRPEELWMPVLKYLYLANTPRSINSDKTILNYFVENNEFINSRDKVKALNAFAGMGDKGSECFAVICRSAQGNKTFRLREPLALTWMPVQLHGLVYEIPGRGRFAGFQVMYPAAISINSGI